MNATNASAGSFATPIPSRNKSQAVLLTQVESNQSKTDVKSTYEQRRPMIIWLGLTELGWIGYWLLSGGGNTSMFVALAVAWIVGMLMWVALVIHASRRDFFLKQSERLSNLVGVTIVLSFAVAMFATVPAGWQGLVNAAHGTSDLQLISVHILRLLGGWSNREVSAARVAATFHRLGQRCRVIGANRRRRKAIENLPVYQSFEPPRLVKS